MGYYDSNGIYHHEEGDPADPGRGFSTLLNLAANSVSGAVPNLVSESLADPEVTDIVTNAVQTAVEDLGGPFVGEGDVKPNDYMVPFTDESRRVLGGIYDDGSVEYLKPVGTLPSVPSGVQGLTPLVSENDRIFGRIYDDGSIEFEKLINSTGSASALREGMTVSDRTAIAAVGDSLTDSNGGTWPNEDTWPGHLGVANPNAVVTNLGEGGFTVDEVAIKVGALTLTTQAPVTVPSSGTVNIPVQSGIGWRTHGRTVSIPGTLGGIPGQLTRIPGTPVTLTFESDGTASGSVPAGATFQSAHDPHKWDVLILGAGRNDISLNVTGTHGSVVEHVTVGLQRIIDWMAPQRKRLLLWGTLNASTDPVGSSNYNEVMGVNSWCAKTYPDVWIDIRSWLVNDAIYEIGITPTQADLNAMANDAPPPSVTDGGVHFTKAAAALIAPIFDQAIRRRDWKA